MKTSDVKVNMHYLHKGEIHKVLKRIKGKETKKENMQSGMMFTGYKCSPKKFLLDNGDVVYAKELEPFIKK